VPDWIGTGIFFLALGLTAAKVNEDIGQYGLVGYMVLLLMTFVYAAGIGLAYL
jgi:hypothetical protein